MAGPQAAVPLGVVRAGCNSHHRRVQHLVSPSLATVEESSLKIWKNAAQSGALSVVTLEVVFLLLRVHLLLHHWHRGGLTVLGNHRRLLDGLVGRWPVCELLSAGRQGF